MDITPQPDRARGLFETMLVTDGRPVELEAHMVRLAASLDALFGEETPDGTAELVAARAGGIELGRLRLTVAPTGAGPFEVEIVAKEVDPELVFPSPERAVNLIGVVVPDGLGAHKWTDRSQIESAKTPSGSVPLLLDAGDVVLEASRANVFAVVGGALRTPPTDGRILPGIARRRTIEVAAEDEIEFCEGAITVSDLASAEEVFLTGSVRGVEPVKAINGEPVPPAGEIGRRIATRLRRLWLG